MTRQSNTKTDRDDLDQLEVLRLQNELYRRAQVALEEHREETASMFENAPVGFFVLGEDGSIRRVNRRAADELGVRAKDLVNVKFQKFVSEPSTALFAEQLVFRSGRKSGRSSDLLLRRANGVSFWARTRSERSRASSQVDERIIFTIDDEELVLNATVRVLRRMGYEIVSFTEPDQALLEFEEAPGAYDAIVTDFRMPGMNGLELSKRLMALRHDVPILLTSAFTNEIDKSRVEEIGIERVLQKPLSAEELGLWLAEVIPALS
jgi:PAS domain S-box-containing protein